MSDQAFDLVVIGCGLTGEKAAAQAAWAGHSVAVIEREPVPGGAAVNTGTLASKSLRESALLLSGYRQRKVAGLEVRVRAEPTVEALMAHRQVVAKAEQQRILDNLDRHGVTLIGGTARVAGPHRVEVTGDEGVRALEARFILVATGSSPARPAWVPFDAECVNDSDQLLEMERVPRSLIILGAGVIGCEYATLFAALGTKVTVVDGRPHLLPFLDRELGQQLERHFRSELGGTLISETRATGCRLLDGGGVEVDIGDAGVVEANRLLVCAGRRPNTGRLGLEAVGVELTAKGAIRVDDSYRSTVPSILGAGDVLGSPSLASVGMEQARIAVCRAFGLTYKQGLSGRFPLGVYTIPELASVGYSLADAEAEGLDVATGRAAYGENARGRIEGVRVGFLKLVFRVDDRVVVGAQMFGDRATELIHIAGLAVDQGLSLHVFIDGVFNYPTLSELYKYAAYDGLSALAKRGMATGME